jgi:adenylylsulfate kinase
VTGTVGVGKTTVVEKVAGLLAEAGEPHAWIDLDALSAAWPRPSDDPFNTRLSAHNLECVATNTAAAGARSLVLAGVVKTRNVLELYENAIGVAITVVRLKSPRRVVEARLRRRYDDTDTESLKWHLDRAPELDAIRRVSRGDARGAEYLIGDRRRVFGVGSLGRDRRRAISADRAHSHCERGPGNLGALPAAAAEGVCDVRSRLRDSGHHH